MEASIAATVNDPPRPRVRACVRAAGLILLGAFSCMARADWQVIYAAPEQFVELDPSTLREMPPFLTVWTRITYTKAQNDDEQNYQSQSQLHAIDCETRGSTVVGMVNYSGALGQGQVGERRPRPRAEWKAKPAPPESLAALVIDTACRSRKNP